MRNSFVVGFEIGGAFKIVVNFGIEVGFVIVLDLEMGSKLHQSINLVVNK